MKSSDFYAAFAKTIRNDAPKPPDPVTGQPKTSKSEENKLKREKEAKEKADRDRQEKERLEREAREKAEREKQEREAKEKAKAKAEKAERAEREAKEREKAERSERDRLEKEKAEKAKATAVNTPAPPKNELDLYINQITSLKADVKRYKSEVDKLRKENDKLRSEKEEIEKELAACKEKLADDHSDEEQKERAVVLHDFDGDEENKQLRLRKGEYVTVLAKHESGWWTGELPNGDVGFFPEGFVEVVN